MIAATLGDGGLAGQGKSPGTRAKAVAMLRAELMKAKDYVAKQAGPEDKRPARDLQLEALAQGDHEPERAAPRHGASRRQTSSRRCAWRRSSTSSVVLDGAAESYLSSTRSRPPACR